MLPLMFLAISWTSVGERQISSNLQQLSEPVSLCELTKNWKKYDHSVVHVEAIYRAAAETSEVYDLGCPDTAHVAWVPPDLDKMVPDDKVKEMSRLLKADGRAQIVAVGEFDGPKHVSIPPETSPGLAKTLQAADSRYGHQNGWDFQFVISRIEKVGPVPSNAPWPRWARERREVRPPAK